MFNDKPIFLENQSSDLENEEDYYKEDKFLSFSSLKAMFDCPSQHLLGEPQKWDKAEFLIGHGAEKYALEGPEAFEDWIKNGKKDGEAVIDKAMKQPTKASMDLYDKLLIAQSWLRSQKRIESIQKKLDDISANPEIFNQEEIDALKDEFSKHNDWKLQNGKKPTSAQIKAMTKILDEHGIKFPVMPQPTEAYWVNMCRICGESSRRSKWMMDLVTHPDTRFQEAISIEWGRTKFKMRLDIINPTLQIIFDFKTVGYKLDRNGWKSETLPSGKKKTVRINFVEDQHYLLQAGIYTVGAYAKYGEFFDYFIGAVEKGEMPRFEILSVPFDDIQPYMKKVDEQKNLYYDMKNGKIKPFMCDKHTCKYCASRRRVDKPIYWREI